MKIKIVGEADQEKELKKLLLKKSLDLRGAEEKAVFQILEQVAKTGDRAIYHYNEKFSGTKQRSLKVSEKEVKRAYKKVGSDFLAALKVAIKAVYDYHKKQKPDEWFETLPDDVILGQRITPIEKVGVYVPGGSAKYPSSVLMSIIPAKVAGVAKIYLASPPPIDVHVLVAAAEVGVDGIFAAGGAQAIAAFAYGTETVPKVDMIVGPGNIYVTLAKKMVYGRVGIDSLAGPSDLAILADKDAEVDFMAADMISQAEHDPNSSVVLVTTSKEVARSVQEKIAKQLVKAKRKKIIEQALNDNSLIFVAKSNKEAIEIINRIAPEHLELLIASPLRVLEEIKNAGAVFLGPYSPVVVGDYIAGPSHVLPTAGTARFSSPLGVYDFVKKQSLIGYTKPALKKVAKHIKTLALVEGLDAHARAIDVRFS